MGFRFGVGLGLGLGIRVGVGEPTDEDGGGSAHPKALVMESAAWMASKESPYVRKVK